MSENMLEQENAEWEVICILMGGETRQTDSCKRACTTEKLKLNSEGPTVPLRKVREGKAIKNEIKNIVLL